MNKQIEEMAKDIRTAENNYLCAMLTADIDDAIDGAAPRNERLATALCEMGYRKSTDVADAYNERLKYLFEIMGAQILLHLDQICEEFKKKYESEGVG